MTLTALSRRSPSLGRLRAAFGLAYKSLLVLAAVFGTSGCIVADPPEYEKAQRSPPFLDLAKADPWPGKLIVIDRQDDIVSNDTKEFTIPVRSEDQGEGLTAGLYLDYGFDPRPSDEVAVVIPASTMDDLNRSIRMTWPPRAGDVSSGCHQLTLLVTHSGNWSTPEHGPSRDAVNDIGMGTWWVSVDPDPKDPFSLRNCPNDSEVQK